MKRFFVAAGILAALFASPAGAGNTDWCNVYDTNIPAAELAGGVRLDSSTFTVLDTQTWRMGCASGPVDLPHPWNWLVIYDFSPYSNTEKVFKMAVTHEMPDTFTFPHGINFYDQADANRALVDVMPLDVDEIDNGWGSPPWYQSNYLTHDSALWRVAEVTPTHVTIKRAWGQGGAYEFSVRIHIKRLRF